MQKLCCAVNLQCLERVKTIRSLILCSDCAFVWLTYWYHQLSYIASHYVISYVTLNISIVFNSDWNTKSIVDKVFENLTSSPNSLFGKCSKLDNKAIGHMKNFIIRWTTPFYDILVHTFPLFQWSGFSKLHSKSSRSSD